MKYLFAVGIILSQLCCAPFAQAVSFDWATIGNAGNTADPQTFRGAVGYEYRIAATEVTNAQYTQFLNAVDPFGLNQRGLYNQFMDENFGGAHIFNNGTVDGARYSVNSDFEQYPVSLVSWYDAARFVNWLHNGQHSGSTENGAYTLLGGTPTPSNANSIVRNIGARYFLPTQDEWYKAAFHDASAGTAGVYFDYATRTNAIPYSDNPAALNTPNDANVANYYNLDGIANGYNDGYAISGTTNPGTASPYTNVGAYALAAGPYGTFDQNGNVREWNETLVTSTTRGIRGGSWFDSANTNSQSLIATASDFVGGGAETGQTGFRIGSVLGIPDPINYVLTVEYRTPEVTGPLIDGYDPLPATLTAVFTLGNVYPGQTIIGRDQVASFQMNLPGGSPTAGDLNSFQLALDAGGAPTSLNWGVLGFDNGTLDPYDILNNNFTLEISGTDPDSGEPFRYFYSESTNTFAPVPEPSTLVLLSLVALTVICKRKRPARGRVVAAQSLASGG